jgi:branched-chain amino acid aminotransferase
MRRSNRMQIEPTEKIWKNGKLVDWKDATVHVLTHGLHYGTGVFEGIRCYSTANGPAVFRLKEHMKRMHSSANSINMRLPYTQEELCKAAKDTVKANKLGSCYIRPIAFYGVSGIGVNPIGAPIEVFIMAVRMGAYLGDEGIKNGIRVHTSSWHRVTSGSVPATAKACGDYLNSAIALMEVKQNGFDEAIMLNELHMVAEGSGENLFSVRDGKLQTPPLNAGILPGITRDAIIKVARDMGYDVVEQNMARSELYLADELFFTGTAAEVTPIREVDRRPVGSGKPGPVTMALQTKFLNIVNGKDKKYASWLDPVK